jgi:hypothetical protein
MLRIKSGRAGFLDMVELKIARPPITHNAIKGEIRRFNVTLSFRVVLLDRGVSTNSYMPNEPGGIIHNRRGFGKLGGPHPAI